MFGSQMVKTFGFFPYLLDARPLQAFDGLEDLGDISESICDISTPSPAFKTFLIKKSGFPLIAEAEAALIRARRKC
ncbi:hypothetical protein ASG81_25720 [Paenibacillus sp. Soil522]|nr:hypothetical protein ASG81_25720 [Paenibacillus sp. Soil522]